MLNRIIVTGRLVADPVLRQAAENVSVCSFRIACDRDFAKQGEEKKTDFFSCTAWRGKAEFVSKYFTKGRLITVDGRLQNKEPWTKDGVEHREDEITADNVYFGDSKKDAAPTDGQAAEGAPYAPPPQAPAAPGGYPPPEDPYSDFDPWANQ